MKKPIICCFSAVLILFICSCNDPVFYQISQEVKPVRSLINGSPTKMVEFGGSMYVASGKILFRYDGGWNTQFRPGRIHDIAATNSALYVLYEGTFGTVLESTTGSGWTTVSTDNIISIYAANNELFAGVLNETSYSVARFTGGSFSTLIGSTESSWLNGVAYDGTYYYFCTNGSGIYTTDNLSTPPTRIQRSNGTIFMGIITLPNNNGVIASTRSGFLYKIDSDTVGSYITIIPNGRNATSALYVWQNPSNASQYLLLVGRQDALAYSTDTGYTYGYVEMELSSSGGIVSGNLLREPGLFAVTTVNFGENERFKSTIGKCSVNDLRLYKGVLFASTQINGLWSYRLRNGFYHWNTE